MATLELNAELGLEMAHSESKVWQDEKTTKLLDAMLRGSIPEVKPQLNPESELGFSFPAVNQLLDTSDKESMAILERLSSVDILVKRFSDKFLYCPQCGSINIRPVYCCPKCGTGNIIRGRVLEHLMCQYIGTEDEFFLKGRLVCPKCSEELHSLGTDYRSLGVLHKCRDCGEIFHQPAIKWSCLKCSSITLADRITAVDSYSYSLNEKRRNRVEFELKPEPKLLQFVRERGYQIKENAGATGRSGAQHTFDFLATRDDGIVVHNIAIGIEIADKPIELNKVFGFDNKAYDIGFYNKLLIAIPELTPEARQFAARQRIRVLESADLEAFLASNIFPSLPKESEVEVEMMPFDFKSKSGLVEYLQSHGYEIKENAKVKGRSGAEHAIDILASRDDGILVHSIVIAVEASEQPIGIDKVFDFDDKAYDAGIRNKIFIAVPRLTPEAARFARRQGVRVFETPELEPAG